jgi:hypothetical protein
VPDRPDEGCGSAFNERFLYIEALRTFRMSRSMRPAEIYRRRAHMQREAAAATDLPNRKAMHERAAEQFEEMAKTAEYDARLIRIHKNPGARARQERAMSSLTDALGSVDADPGGEAARS